MNTTKTRTHIILFILIFSSLSILTSSCNYKSDNDEFITTEKYAKLYSLTDSTIIIQNAWENNNSYQKYNIVPDGVKRVVCMSSSHIAYLAALNSEDIIVGVSGAHYLSNEYIKQKVKNGRITDIGYEGSINYEVLLTLKPDLVIAYGIKGSNNSYISKIEQYGIPVLTLPDYLETDPLGRMEYLRLFAALVGNNIINKADSIISAVAGRYNELSTLITENNITPKKVLLNAPWRDQWYIPGADSYFATLVKNAGGIILGAKEGEINAYPYSSEEIFMLGQDADLWLNPGHFFSMQEITAGNPLISKMSVYKGGKIFNNNKRSTEGGGNDFFESGVVEPHLILEDLIRILHPDLLPDLKNQPYHYYIMME